MRAATDRQRGRERSRRTAAARAAAVGLAASLALGLAACGGDDDDNDAPAGEAAVSAAPTQAGTAGATPTTTGAAEDFTLTIAEPTDIVTLNPYAQSSSPGYSTWGFMLEPLLRYDYPTSSYVPILATSWELEDPTTWTFHLREGVQFHDGSPFTSADVIHSFDRMKHDDDSGQAQLLESLEEVVADGDYTVKFITSTPVVNFPFIMHLRNITSKTTFDEYGPAEADQHPNGTGPYTFGSYESGAQVVVNRFDGYWGDPVEPSTVVVRIIPDPSSRLAALERGEVDIIRGVPVQDAERVGSQANIRLESIVGVRNLFMPMSFNLEPFQDARVREAVVSALDLDTIAGTIFEGQFTVATGAIPPGVIGFDPEGQTHPYDPDRARQLLADAGFADGGPAITFVTPTDRYPKDREFAQAVAQYLQAVGFDITLETPEWGTFSTEMNENRYGFYQISRGGLIEGHELLMQYFQTGASLRNNYSDPELDELLTQVVTEPDAETRERIQIEAGRLAYDRFAAVFVGTYNDLYGVSNRIEWTPDSSEIVYPWAVGLAAAGG